MLEYKIQTEHGLLSAIMSEPYETTSVSDTAILFIHGNSTSSRIFEPLYESEQLNTRHKLIAFDLPGHGRSSDAPSPEATYYQYGYAEAALHVLRAYNVENFIVFGWGLGGNVALELVAVLASPRNTTNIQMLGAMITGTPPVARQNLVGIRPDADLTALHNPNASIDELSQVSEMFTRQPAPEWLIEAVIRTDRRASNIMLQKYLAGQGSDQIQVIHRFPAPAWIAVVNGELDPILDVDYCEQVCDGAPRLWHGQCIRMPGQGHAPFFDDPQPFIKLFVKFVDDCTQGGEEFLNSRQIGNHCGHAIS